MTMRAPPPYLTEQALTAFIRAALEEDIGEGDHTSLGSVPAGCWSAAQLLIKGHGILAGMEAARCIMRYYDERLSFTPYKHDGDTIQAGDIAFLVEGPSRSILATERLTLNCMQRMSGIATRTRNLCRQLEGTHAMLLDTRKTTPNFRLMEKWGVYIGGGKNHRFALYDGLLIKDNHIDIAGGVTNAVKSVQRYLRETQKKLPLEVETRTLAEVQEALQAGGVDVIMLDNMPVDQMKKAVALIEGRAKTEASGGISEATLREVALCGVDFISVGGLTHSISSIDMSLKVIAEQQRPQER